MIKTTQDCPRAMTNNLGTSIPIARMLLVEFHIGDLQKRHILENTEKSTKSVYSIMWFLKRNFKSVKKPLVRPHIEALVRPHIEYSTVWNPHYEGQVNKIELVQRKTARYVTNIYHNTSSVTSMSNHLQWKSGIKM